MVLVGAETLNLKTLTEPSSLLPPSTEHFESGMTMTVQSGLRAVGITVCLEHDCHAVRGPHVEGTADVIVSPRQLAARQDANGRQVGPQHQGVHHAALIT
jgi:hypothetical protein